MKNKDVKKALDELIPHPKCPLNYEKDYELLLAVMLSAQTTDERVNEVTKELFKYSLEELSTMKEKKIEEIIKSVGMGKRKSHYIKQIANELLKKCDGSVPHDRTFVESLPGVGHKTCNVVFSELFDEPSLAVDTHVSRVSKRWGLAEQDDDVLTIENKLCSFFEEKDWREVHVQLVLFGRYYCTAKSPKCSNCPFENICKKPRD